MQTVSSHTGSALPAAMALAMEAYNVQKRTLAFKNQKSFTLLSVEYEKPHKCGESVKLQQISYCISCINLNLVQANATL